MKIQTSQLPTQITPPALEPRTSLAGVPTNLTSVHLSGEARALSQAIEKLSVQGDIREDKIAEARLALADGSLDTDAALELALDRMIADLVG